MRRVGGWLCVVVLAFGCRAGKTRPDERAAPQRTTTARASGSIAGEVRSGDRGLAGAQVCARLLAPTHTSVAADVEPICTVTDGRGQFELEVPSGVLFVVAAAEQHRSRGQDVVVRGDEPGPSVAIELLPGGRAYAGTVVDVDGRPIPGAKVFHVTRLGPRTAWGVEVEADAQGRFRLWSNRDGRLDARAPGFARGAGEKPDDRRLVLAPESVVVGTVVDLDGLPVAGARVNASSDGPLGGWPQHSVRTDAEGRFELTGLGPGRHGIEAVAELASGWFADWEQRSLGPAERHEGVVLTLAEPLRPHRLEVVDAEDGAPVAGCFVGLRVHDDADRDAHAWTDEQGRIELALGLAHRVVALACPGYVADPPFPAIADRLLPARVEVRKGATLHGTLVDEGQRPVAGVHVSLARLHDDIDDRTWSSEDISDARGRFTIAGLVAGDYELELTGAGRFAVVAPRYPSVTIGEQPRERRIFAIGGGRVEVEVGLDAIGRKVQLNDCRFDAVYPEMDARVETDGLAVFERVKAGRYRLALTDNPLAVCGDKSTVELELAPGEHARVRIEPDELEEEIIEG